MDNVCNANHSTKCCTGCGSCAVICPQKCITMEYNKDGFLAPVVNESKCIGCGVCTKVCYKFSEDFGQGDLFSASTVYAAISNDVGMLRTVSSGGVAPAIERFSLANGYEVCGVNYNARTDQCMHSIASTESETGAFRSTKYIQSNTLPAFSSFESGKKYCVFGTPCQIFGLDRILTRYNERENYILVDLFCKGIPSRIMWQSYLSYIKRTEQMTDISSIVFRSKAVSWHKFQMQIVDADGKQYKNDVYHDLFFQCFIKNVCFNDSCYDCEFRHHYSAADIRLGDFWGSKYYSHEEGVSLVVILTDKGKTVWNAVSNEFWTEQNDPQIVYESQRFDKLDKYLYREKMLHNLRSGDSLDCVYERYDMQNIKYKKSNKEDSNAIDTPKASIKQREDS